MAGKSGKANKNTIKSMHSASSPEARQQQLVAAAVNLAEKQLLEGTASPSVITHYLKYATRKAQLEEEILEKQKELIVAKTESLQSAQRMEELYRDAMAAMIDYRGGIGE